MKYLHYKIEDYLTDQKFKSWVLEPNPDLDHFWKSFLDQYPEKKDDLSKAKKMISALNFPDPPSIDFYDREDLEELIHKVFKSSEINNKPERLYDLGIYTIWNKFKWTSRAASILLLGLSLGVVWLLVFNSKNFEEKNTIVYEFVKNTKKGQKLTIHLEDGTLVQLNSNSRLRYSGHFDSMRTVYLDGEAYFEVVEDPNRPFEVITQDVRTTVLGTKFGIRHNLESGLTDVALLEGKVKVEPVGIINDASKPHILAPMEMVTFSSNSKRFDEGTLDYKSFFGWKEDILVFKNDDFSDVIKKLEDWYGVEFIIMKQVSTDKDFTGEYQDEVLEDILVGIGYTFDVTYELNNKTVIIK